jgi:carbamoylphosphate synthase small subunit
MWFDAGYELIRSKGMQNEADILCFLGGADISPTLYNQKTNPKANVNPIEYCDKRDMEAWKLKRPDQIAVGICRGGQFLNCMSGGKLIQHVSGHVGSPHKVYDTVWNTEVEVASCHHQMMIPGVSAEVFAYTEGHGHNFMGEHGPIDRPKFEPEVLWYDSTRSLCYQGHPEWYPNSGTKYFMDLMDVVRD